MTDYRKFFETAHDLMCVVSKTHFVEVNPAFTRVLGYSPTELISRPFLEFVHPEDVGMTTAMTRLAAFPADGFENRWVAKDGRNVWLSWSVHPTREGECVAAYAVARDASKTKSCEGQLEETVAELKRSNAELTEFAYAASHDLQEPLRTISTYATFIKEDHAAELTGDAVEYLDFIIDAAKQGRSLVSDLLQLSRVGRDAAFSWVDIGSIIDRAVLDEEFKIRESQADVTRDSDLPKIWGDAGMLLLLFRNLISNGLKFRKPEGPARIRVRGGPTDEGWHFWVKDNGIGIDPRYAQQVFAIFKRLDKSRPGTGIGLAICRKVVELHHGKIWIESVPGSGATIHFTVTRPGHVDVPFPEQPDPPPGGGQPPGREGGDARRGAPQAAAEDRSRPGRPGGTTLLASGGTLRDRPTPRFGLSRSELAACPGARSTGGDEAGPVAFFDPNRRALGF